MNVLALSYLYPNSRYPHYGIFVHNRLKAVSRYHKVKVINPIPWFPGCGRLARYRNYDAIPAHETIDGLDVFHPRFPIIPRICKFFDALTYKAVVMPLVAKLRRKFPFDLIDLHWTYPDLPTGTALKKKYGKKMLVTLRGKEAFYHGEGLIREALIRKHLLQANAVISLSRELQDMALENGVDPGVCHIIRNGVDTSKFYYMDMTECRKRLGIPLEEKVLLSVGSLNYRKGFDRIIRALPTIISEMKKIKFYIIGSHGPDKARYLSVLKKLVDKLGLQNNVVFVGTVKNEYLLYWYNSSDLFCLASRGEGCPNVLLEALSCGCPALATDVGSVREILTKEFMGQVVPNQDDAIINGLASMLNRKFDRQLIASYMKKYDWDWCARQVHEIYISTLSKLE